MSFVNYVMDFYGPRGIYDRFFESNPISAAEVSDLYSKLLEIDFDFWSNEDTICRELIRDILFIKRGIKSVEYPKAAELFTIIQK